MNADPEHSYPWDHLMALGRLRSHADLPLGILLIVMDADKLRQRIPLKTQESNYTELVHAGIPQQMPVHTISCKK